MLFIIYLLSSYALITQKGKIFSYGKKTYVTYDDTYALKLNNTEMLPGLFRIVSRGASMEGGYLDPFPRSVQINSDTIYNDVHQTGMDNSDDKILVNSSGKEEIVLRVNDFCITAIHNKLKPRPCLKEDPTESQKFKWEPIDAVDSL